MSNINQPEPNVILPEREAQILEQARNNITILEAEVKRVNGVVRQANNDLQDTLQKSADARAELTDVTVSLGAKKTELDGVVCKLVSVSSEVDSAIKKKEETIVETNKIYIDAQNKIRDAENIRLVSENNRKTIEERFAVLNESQEKHDIKVGKLKAVLEEIK